MAVLLLNASYEPLAVIPKWRAMSLLRRGRVDAATNDMLAVQGVTTTFRIPTVIRLKRYINVPRRHARWSRQGVMERDSYSCIYCGIGIGGKQTGRILTKRDFTIDHIIPKSRNGQNTWGNTACACPACNHRKGDRTPHEAGMNMLWEPKTPRVDYLVAYGEIPDSWKLYLEL